MSERKVHPRTLKAAGALFILLAWYLSTEKLERQLGLRAEQQAADTYGFVSSTASVLSSKIDVIQSELGLVRQLVTGPGAPAAGRLAPTDTSADLYRVELDLNDLAGRLGVRSGGHLDRAQTLALQSATLPGIDSIGAMLFGIVQQQVSMTLGLDSLRDSLARLRVLVDAGPASRLPGRRAPIASEAAAWASGRLAAMQRSLDSSSARLDQLEATLPMAAFAQRERTERSINRLKGIIFFAYLIGSLLIVYGEYTDRAGEGGVGRDNTP